MWVLRVLHVLHVCQHSQHAALHQLACDCALQMCALRVRKRQPGGVLGGVLQHSRTVVLQVTRLGRRRLPSCREVRPISHTCEQLTIC